MMSWPPCEARRPAATRCWTRQCRWLGLRRRWATTVSICACCGPGWRALRTRPGVTATVRRTRACWRRWTACLRSTPILPTLPTWTTCPAVQCAARSRARYSRAWTAAPHGAGRGLRGRRIPAWRRRAVPPPGRQPGAASVARSAGEGPPGPRWQQFLSRLRAEVSAGADIAQACAGACAAFDALIAHLPQQARQEEAA